MTNESIRKLLLFGAGRSATALIDYILTAEDLSHTTLTIADRDIDLAREKIGARPRGRAVAIEINDEQARRALIKEHDLVISLLPAGLHHLVIEDCLALSRHLCTASYVDDVMQRAHDAANDQGLLFMGELGLDPGLDHMSALLAMEEIRERGGELISFKSYTGGLVAPESDDNPWHYKVSWNPRNVVLAGQGMSTYRYDGRQKFIPYGQLFARSEEVDITGMAPYEMYVNRDSVRYASIYNIEDIPTIVRGTLRHQGYCAAWQALIDLGFTNTAQVLGSTGRYTYEELLDALVPGKEGDVRQRVASYLKVALEDDIMHKLDYLGLFSDEMIDDHALSMADILEGVIKRKWMLQPDDRDMIIMQHEYEYLLDGHPHAMTSTLVEKGRDSTYTAMSRLVGLPLAIYVEMVATGRISSPTSSRPIHPSVYGPVMSRLEALGVTFDHREVN